MMLVVKQTHKENSMTQINFTLELEQVQKIIEKSGANDHAKQMLTTIFNQLMQNNYYYYLSDSMYSKCS